MIGRCHFLLDLSVRILTAAPFLKVYWAGLGCSVESVKVLSGMNDDTQSKLASFTDEKPEVWGALLLWRTLFQAKSVSAALSHVADQCCACAQGHIASVITQHESLDTGFSPALSPTLPSRVFFVSDLGPALLHLCSDQRHRMALPSSLAVTSCSGLSPHGEQPELLSDIVFHSLG